MVLECYTKLWLLKMLSSFLNIDVNFSKFIFLKFFTSTSLPDSLSLSLLSRNYSNNHFPFMKLEKNLVVLFDLKNIFVQLLLEGLCVMCKFYKLCE